MAFQAPFNPLALREMNMQEQQQRFAQQQQAFDSISGALDNLLGTYVQHEEKKAKGTAMKNAFGVIAPSLGMDEATLKNLTGNLKSPMDWYNFGAEMGPMLPSLINANMARGRMQQAAVMPQQRAITQNQINVANQGGPGIMGATRRISPINP